MKKKKNWCKLDGLLPKLYCEREDNSEFGYCIFRSSREERLLEDWEKKIVVG